MFAAKTTILLALLAASSKLVAAGPPACLLAAINTEPNPADLQAICGDGASKVESQIASLCGSNTDAAMQAFVSSCSAAGKTVPTYSPSTSGTASATGTGSMVTATPVTMNTTIQYTSTYFDSDCSCTKTTALSTVVVSTGFASVSATGAAMIPTTALGTAKATSTQTGAATNVRIGSCAAVLIGVAGFFMTM
ncbi:hypothetical protein MMC30_001591 [Trapelia coarctata]|nr:hypothetical protein [Trapelia coarctata]